MARANPFNGICESRQSTCVFKVALVSTELRCELKVTNQAALQGVSPAVRTYWVQMSDSVRNDVVCV